MEKFLFRFRFDFFLSFFLFFHRINLMDVRDTGSRVTSDF